MYGVENVWHTFRTYADATVFLPLFLICFLYCYLSGKAEDKKRMLLMAGLSILFVFNDISRKIIGKVTELSTYYRFIWAVPMVVLAAFAVTKLFTECKKTTERVVVIVLASGVLLCSSSTFFGAGRLKLPANRYNISGDVVEVCDIIAEDKKEERPVVIFDMEMQLPARTYDASLIWGISRNAYSKHNNLEEYESAGKYRDEKIMIRAVNYGVQEEGEVLREALLEKGVDYIVTQTAFGMDAYLDEIGYGLVGISSTRSVYAKR